MKKIFAFALVILMLFLCACSDKDNINPPAISATPTDSTAKASSAEYITEWKEGLLPEIFPAPPAGTHDFSFISSEDSDGEYARYNGWARITFICPEKEFYSFANELTVLGYYGGFKNVINGTYYSSRFQGYWQNDKNYVKINESTPIDNGEIIFSIDVGDCFDSFPDELNEYFPKFYGYSQSDGIFCGHDLNGKEIKEDFNGNVSSDSEWYWEFRFDNGFIGVEKSEFEDYFYLLEDEGFDVIMVTSVVDGFTVITGNAVKDVNGTEFAALMLYNTHLKTLDIAYTNNASFYLDQ